MLSTWEKLNCTSSSLGYMVLACPFFSFLCVYVYVLVCEYVCALVYVDAHIWVVCMQMKRQAQGLSLLRQSFSLTWNLSHRLGELAPYFQGSCRQHLPCSVGMTGRCHVSLHMTFNVCSGWPMLLLMPVPSFSLASWDMFVCLFVFTETQRQAYIMYSIAYPLPIH